MKRLFKSKDGGGVITPMPLGSSAADPANTNTHTNSHSSFQPPAAYTRYEQQHSRSRSRPQRPNPNPNANANDYDSAYGYDTRAGPGYDSAASSSEDLSHQRRQLDDLVPRSTRPPLENRRSVPSQLYQADRDHVSRRWSSTRPPSRTQPPVAVDQAYPVYAGDGNANSETLISAGTATDSDERHQSLSVPEKEKASRGAWLFGSRAAKKDREREREREREVDASSDSHSGTGTGTGGGGGGGVASEINWLCAQPGPQYDWDRVPVLADAVSRSDAAAKAAAYTLRKEFKHGSPQSQRRAARLWGLLTIRAGDRFRSHVVARRFLETVEATVVSTKTPLSVKESMLTVLGVLAYEFPHDSSFAKCWNKVRPSDRPQKGESIHSRMDEFALTPHPPQMPRQPQPHPQPQPTQQENNVSVYSREAKRPRDLLPQAPASLRQGDPPPQVPAPVPVPVPVPVPYREETLRDQLPPPKPPPRPNHNLNHTSPQHTHTQPPPPPPLASRPRIQLSDPAPAPAPTPARADDDDDDDDDEIVTPVIPSAKALGKRRALSGEFQHMSIH